MKGNNNDYFEENLEVPIEIEPINGVDYNRAGSSSVEKVDSIEVMANSHSMSLEGIPNSVSQNYRDGKLDSERYYGEDGKAYLDIDYTNHGNPKTHPEVPHQHRITYDSNGKIHRDSTDTEVK